jgi:nucleotide-binding universal stress UspA family protein
LSVTTRYEPLFSSLMNLSHNKILVAVDFEEQSLTALEQSFALARLFDASIMLLFVIEEGSGISRLISPDDHQKRVMEKAREKFHEIEHLARATERNYEVPVSYQVKKGKPYEMILETARDHDVILIVMGKGGSDDKRRRGFMGGNTLNVVRQAACPVITLTSGQTIEQIRNILVPVDFTGQTKRQVDMAIEFGKFFDANIRVLSVVRTENKITRLLKQVQINQVRNALLRNQVKCQAEIIQHQGKHVSEVVCDYALTHQADLVIIMTQLRKQISRLFIGTIAQEIIFSSDVPVMSINPSTVFHPEVVTSFVDPLGLLKIKEKSLQK